MDNAIHNRGRHGLLSLTLLCTLAACSPSPSDQQENLQGSLNKILSLSQSAPDDAAEEYAKLFQRLSEHGQFMQLDCTPDGAPDAKGAFTCSSETTQFSIQLREPATASTADWNGPLALYGFLVTSETARSTYSRQLDGLQLSLQQACLASDAACKKWAESTQAKMAAEDISARTYLQALTLAAQINPRSNRVRQIIKSYGFNPDSGMDDFALFAARANVFNDTDETLAVFQPAEPSKALRCANLGKKVAYARERILQNYDDALKANVLNNADYCEGSAGSVAQTKACEKRANAQRAFDTAKNHRDAFAYDRLYSEFKYCNNRSALPKQIMQSDLNLLKASRENGFSEFPIDSIRFSPPPPPPPVLKPVATQTPVAKTPAKVAAKPVAPAPAVVTCSAATGALQQASVRERTQPVYPPALLRSGTTGSVVVKIEYDAAGNVTGASLFKSSRTREFDRSALTAVKKWKINPGAPCPGSALITVDFTL